MSCAKKNPNLTVRTYTHLSASKKRPAGPIGKTSMGPRSSSRDSSKKRTRDRTSSTGQGPCLVADVTTHLAHARRCLSPFLPPPLAPSPPRRSSPRLPPRFVSFRVFLASSSVFSRGNRGPSRWRGRSTPPARAARDGVRVPSPGRPRWMDRRRDARSDARMD